MRRMLAGSLLSISLVAGCSDDSGPTAPTGSVFPQTIRGTVTGASPICSDYFDEFEAPCQQFQVIAPRGRTLVARLTWSDPNTYLRLGSGASASIINWNPCSASGCVSRIGVATGEVSLAVGLDIERSAGTSQAFEIALSLE